MECIWTFQGQKIHSRVEAMPDSLTVRYIIEVTRLMMFGEEITLVRSM